MEKKAKPIILDSTRVYEHGDKLFVVTIDGVANSVWEDLEQAQDEQEKFIAMKSFKKVLVTAITPNLVYPPPHQSNTVVATGGGRYIDSEGTVWEQDTPGEAGVSRLTN